MSAVAPRRLRVIGLPAVGHAYQDSFYAALRAEGVDVVEGYFAGRWLWTEARAGDVVHLHWPSFLYAAPTAGRTLMNAAKYGLFLLALRLRGVRIAWTAHNLYPHRRSRPAGIDALVRRFTIRASERVFAHGEAALQTVEREFPSARGKLVRIPHGHWVGHFSDDCTREQARARLGIAADARVLLFFGGLEPYKNVPVLLRAFAIARRADEQLWLVGRCKDAALKTEIHRLAIPEQGIHLVDRYVDDAEIQHYMRAADIAVMPYRDGLTSGAAILALSFGVPVLAPRVGCFSTIVDADSGLLYEVDARDETQALVDALRAARERTFDATVVSKQAMRFGWDEAARTFARSLASPAHARP